jgi:hypothetical protein
MFLDCLWPLVRKSVTGEWVVSGDGEVHVFFVKGRIAWASSTLAKRAFTGYLTQRGYASNEQVREALEVGRKSGQPFGKVLLANGVCSPDILREAARFQLTAALGNAELLLAEGASHLFLDREGHPWSSDDLFDVEEFVAEESVDDAQPQLDGIKVELPCPLVWVSLLTGQVLARRGDAGSKDEGADLASVAGAALRLLRVSSKAPLEVVVTSGPKTYVLMRLDAHHALVAVPPDGTTLGFARLALTEALQQLRRPTPHRQTP